MSTAHTSMTRMFSQSPSSTAGRESTALSQEKKVSLTRGHPGELTTRATMAPSIASVEAVATTAERRVRAER
jgi:hypothetical protein